ncbi:MAG: GWxTD domain-containing protein [bacterium]|nr:GWxTD domain-containing protein [bacterium]
MTQNTRLFLERLLAAIALSLFLGVPSGFAETATVDSLFQAVKGGIGTVPERESIKALNRIKYKYRKFSPVHFELAKLYMAKDTPHYRWRANEAFQEAIRFDPENILYQIALGALLFRQGFWYNSEKQYLKVLETFPNVGRGCAQAAFGVGYRALKAFLKLQDKEMLANDIFAEEELQKAIRYFEESIAADPSFKDAYYHLGLAYFENQSPEALILVAKQVLAFDPEDINALMFCGLGYQALEVNGLASKYYDQALMRMDPNARRLMESVAYVAPKEDREQLALAVEQGQVEGDISWVDSPDLRLFWRAYDPLFLTDYNERRLEHYGRVAYANLRFSRLWKDVTGWETDKGKTYIKFGRYIHRRSTSATVGQLSRETWYYETFRVLFVNGDGMDHWRFDGYDIGEAHTLLNAGIYPTHGKEVFEDESQRFVDPYLDQKYSLPHQVVAFREADRVRVEVSYAIPLEKIDGADSRQNMHVDHGIFVFDEMWEEVYRHVDRGKHLQRVGQDTLRDRFFLGTQTLAVDEGNYHLVVEVGDRSSKWIGTLRDSLVLVFEDSILTVSDLLLAQDIVGKKEFPETRADLEIVPNPLKLYRRSESAFVYLELYGLTRNRFGQTRFQIAYQVGWPEEKEVDPRLFVPVELLAERGMVQMEAVTDETGEVPFRAVGSEGIIDYRVRYVFPEQQQTEIQIGNTTGDGTETAITATYEGNRQDDMTYLQIDLMQVPEGVHQLRVRVKDLLSGKTVERSVLFRVVE